MALLTLIQPILSTNPLLSLSLLFLLSITILSIYRLSPLHPLSHIPGPTLAKLSSLYLTRLAAIGTESTTVHALHTTYGPLVRTGPNSVHVQPGTALHEIYAGTSTTGKSATGFLKPRFYRNFDIDGHVSVFSATDHTGYRAPRAKAVAGIFAQRALWSGREVVEGCVHRFCARVQREKGRGRKVDVLNVARGLAIDAVTAYLFGRVYGGCDEDLAVSGDGEDVKLTASAMVNAFVAVGRFWYLPPRVFAWVDWIMATFSPDPEADRSIAKIDAFVAEVVSRTADAKDKDDHEDTYQGRLLSASISSSETHAQCKDLIFAGTDSTAMTLATIMHHLSGSPSALAKLKAEIEASDPGGDPQTLVYLRAVVREGLRLAMANPSRLPREVPPSGWTFEGVYMPPGTVVGCSTFELHFNEEVFPKARSFRPERWLEAAGDELEAMNRDFIPFGVGPRQCIARNLATMELFWAVRELVRRDLLEGSRPVQENVEILEWFNSKVVGEKVELEWT